MRLRDSGMPAEALWETYFDVPLILRELGIGTTCQNVAEIGCGHGTFTLPVATVISGTLWAYDIDPAMVRRTQQRVRAAGLSNVFCQVRDVWADGLGLPAGSVDAALVFNLLHCQEPVRLLALAADATRPGGFVLAIHWRRDVETPRGPDLGIRPTAEQIAVWAAQTQELQPIGDAIHLPPWHYGMRLRRQ